MSTNNESKIGLADGVIKSQDAHSTDLIKYRYPSLRQRAGEFPYSVCGSWDVRKNIIIECERTYSYTRPVLTECDVFRRSFFGFYDDDTPCLFGNLNDFVWRASRAIFKSATNTLRVSSYERRETPHSFSISDDAHFNFIDGNVEKGTRWLSDELFGDKVRKISDPGPGYMAECWNGISEVFTIAQ